MKRSKEYIYNRNEQLIKYIEEREYVTVSDLTKHFSMSPSTVRRALEQLENEGMVIRTHGGVKSLQVDRELFLKISPNVNNLAAKNKIAMTAKKYVKNGDVLGIGCGSTTLFFAKLLHDFKHLTVITDSVYVAVELMEDKNIEVYLSGGFVHHTSGAVYSTQFGNLFESSLVDKVFLGADGISMVSQSITAMAHLTEAERTLLTCGDKVYILADNSKFDKKTVIERLAAFQEFDYLITDQKPSNQILELLKEANVKVLY